MDENLVVHAIQYKEQTEFNLRFRMFPNKLERDDFFGLLVAAHDPDLIERAAKVTLIIRVENAPGYENLSDEDFIDTIWFSNDARKYHGAEEHPNVVREAFRRNLKEQLIEMGASESEFEIEE